MGKAVAVEEYIIETNERYGFVRSEIAVGLSKVWLHVLDMALTFVARQTLEVNSALA